MEFGPKFQPLQQAHAPQTASHTLRMWRLMKPFAQVVVNSLRNPLLTGINTVDLWGGHSDLGGYSDSE